jgi:hypothetical protein
MNSEPDISRYCDQMELIKKRIEVVLFFEQRRGGSLYVASTIESVYLQFRKILELIAMASLIANKEIYSQEYANFARHWNARRMLDSLERLNPDFYPKPLIEKVKGSELVDKKDGFLTREDFVTLYNACGAIMHTNNPYGDQTDYGDYFSKIAEWRALIFGLLNNHKIHLLNDPNMYVIHMQEDRDNKVHGYTFAPVSRDEPQST